MVANISAEIAAHSETVSTLKFASFATKTQQLVSLNQVCKEPEGLSELKNEVRRLHALLDAGRREALTDDPPTPHKHIYADAHAETVGGAAEEEQKEGVSRSEGGGEGTDMTVKRLQVLLWQACEREEKVREKLTRERGCFRTRIHEYEGVCNALAFALETAGRRIASTSTPGLGGGHASTSPASTSPTPSHAPQQRGAAEESLSGGREAEVLSGCASFDLDTSFLPTSECGMDGGAGVGTGAGTGRVGALEPAVEGGGVTLWGEGVMLRREVEEARRLLDVERETVGAVGEEVRAAREVVE